MKFLIALVIAFSSFSAYAVPSPFDAATIGRLKLLENKKVARVIFDTKSGTNGAVGAHGLGAFLPAKAIITRSYLYVVTQFSDTGSGTVALHCEDANNIKTATDITGTAAGGLIEGESTGATSAMKAGIANACQITATVGTVPQLTGKLIAFIEYVVGQ